MNRSPIRIASFWALIGGLACTGAFGGELTDPMDVLKKADAAIKKVKLVSYDADYTATEWIRKFVPDVKGSVVLGEESKGEIAKFRADVSIRSHKSDDEQSDAGDSAGKDEVLKVIAGSDGDEYFLLDPKSKTVYQDMDPAVLGKNSRNIQRVVMKQFVAKNPFEDELKVEEMKLEEAEKVSGHDCYKVRLKMERNEAIWYFSKKDSLPRRVDRIHKNGEGEEGMTKLVISDLKTSPDFKGNPFAPNAPADYKTTDEFAP